MLIDVAALHGVTMLPASYGIGSGDLADALRRQGTSLEAGDVVLVRTGRMSVWPAHEAFLLDEPGLTREGAEYLARAGAIVIGSDNVGLEQHPSSDRENWQPAHTFLLAEAGIPIVEVLNLEELAEARVYEFLFLGAALRLRGAIGSPLRPLAIPIAKR